MNLLNTIGIKIFDIISLTNNLLWTYVILYGLILLAIYLTFKISFSQILKIRWILEEFKQKNEKKSDVNKKKISSLQALFLATAVRAGSGNLSGVAIAITLGGPGAIVWMWILAILGSATCFFETILGQLYKEKNYDGTFVGGPYHYISKGLGSNLLAVISAISIVMSYGLAFNMFQSNQILASIQKEVILSSNIQILVVILVIFLFALCILGGVTQISSVTSTLVPVMAFLYISTGIYIITINIHKFPSVLYMMFSQAFGIESFAGGTLGVVIVNGVKRGVFSNEAGMGGGSIASSTADINHPVQQGFIQIVGIFLDTLILCTTTAFILLFTDTLTHNTYQGIQLVQFALQKELPIASGFILVVSVFLFCFTSMIGNYYYAESAINYLFKKFDENRKKNIILIYKFISILFIYIGAFISLDKSMVFVDFTVVLLALANIFTVLYLSDKVIAVYKNFKEQKEAKLIPKFNLDSIKDSVEVTNMYKWDNK